MNKTIRYTLVASALTLGMVSCQDDWDAHYDQQADTQHGTESLYEIMAAKPELSDFCKVLKATKAFANSKQTPVTYAEILNADQFFTVWAPVNGTFNCDSLVQLCQTSEGDSLVELHFVKNHLARYSHSFNGVEKNVMMFNGKTLALSANSFGQVEFNSSNTAARNGLLHELKHPISYYYNIYEALVAKEEYQHIGKFLRSYQIDELDEKNSLAMGIVDGETVYSDSVFKSRNDLLVDHIYGRINKEDSLYWMIVPTRQLWDSLYAEAETYYNYAFVEKADSIHERWSHYALMQDLVYNPNPKIQVALQDSIVSTTWRERQNSTFHTYYKPFEQGGLFATAWSGTEQCSNGMIYQVDQWPFVKEKTYFTRINVEAEGRMYQFDEAGSDKTKKLGIEYHGTRADSVSGGGYIVVNPDKQTDKYWIEYELPDVLSGTYDVCVVFLPRSVDPSLPFSEDIVPAGKRNRRSSKFTVEVTYAGTDGKLYTIASNTRYSVDPENPAYYVKTTDKNVPYLFDCNVNATAATRAFINDPFCVDTVKLCTMHFPTCNFDQIEVTNRLKIINAIQSNETNKYWGCWFIDRVLLLPHKEEATEN